MADKTTTLKTKTNDNVYPNVIGDNRDNAISDSPQIKHTLTAEHKINFRLDTNVNNLINNSLQKPAGLTKTKLVGVGTNGQENIEIGDNLTLANGKLSATGGGSSGDFDIVTLSEDGKTYTGTISGSKPLLIKEAEGSQIIATQYAYNTDDNTMVALLPMMNKDLTQVYRIFSISSNNVINSGGEIIHTYYHFITMTNSTDNVSLYITIQDNFDTEYNIYTLASYILGKKILANGNLHGSVPTYISGEGGVIKIYYRTPGDSNINPTPDEYQDLSSFTITDLVTPVV